jgi:hypothetical protein
MRDPQPKIIGIDHHRNGIGGAPFDVVLFEDEGPQGSHKLAVVFGEQYHCAVFDVTKLSAGDIAFGSNSWRGDAYEGALRKAIKAWEPAVDSEHPGSQAKVKAGCDVRPVEDPKLTGTRT